jgi:hypothetical protein
VSARRRPAGPDGPENRVLAGTGRYWIYENPDGSAAVEWSADGGTGDGGQQHIPAELWRLVRAVADGRQLGPQAVLRMLAGGKVPRRGLE